MEKNINPKPFPKTSKLPTLTKMLVYRTNRKIELFCTQKEKSKTIFQKKYLKLLCLCRTKNPLSSKKIFFKKNHKNLSMKLYS